MHVLFQLKVPLDLAQSMREKLDAITTDHVAEVVQLQKKIKVAPDPSKLMERGKALEQRGRRLNAYALIREALRLGHESIVKLDNKILLARLAKDGIVRGRPSLGGPKRGS